MSIEKNDVRLLEIIAREVNMVPDELIGNLGDVHLYKNHIEQAKEQIGREYTLDERITFASREKTFDPLDFGVGEEITEKHCHEICDSYEVPRHTRKPYPLPILKIKDGYDIISGLEDMYKIDSFELENYQSHPAIKAPLSN